MDKKIKKKTKISIKKERKKLKDKFQLFNFTKFDHKDRLYVNGIKKGWWKRPKKKNELTEKTFYKTLKIFMPQHKDTIVSNKKLPDTKYVRISPDYRIDLTDATSFNSKTKKIKKIKGIIFEYDGDKHYQSALQMHADKLKMKEIARLKYRRIRIPFYYQLTQDLTKFIFNGLMFHYTGKTYFTKSKWKKAVQEIYRHPTTSKKIKPDDFKSNFPFIGSPGMHATEYVPGSFNLKALKKFVKDFEWKSNRKYSSIKTRKIKPRHPDAAFPESTKHQIIKTLELYIEDTNNGEGGKPEDLILPSKETKYGRKLNKIYNKIKSSYKNKYLEQVFFGREKYDDIFPELYPKSNDDK